MGLRARPDGLRGAGEHLVEAVESIAAALATASGVPLSGYRGRTWLLFFALALVPTIGGHGLVNKSLRSIPAPTVGLFLLGEPVLASLLAWIVFHEVPGPWTFAGGVVVLVALALVLARRG